MQVWLNNTEKEQLYNELLAYFGLIGATNECTALEAAAQHFPPEHIEQRSIHRK